MVRWWLAEACSPCLALVKTLEAACAGQDVAIAYGYNNIAQSEPRIWGAGSELPLSQLSEALRLEAAMAGFTEVPHSRTMPLLCAEGRCCCNSACNVVSAIYVLAVCGYA